MYRNFKVKIVGQPFRVAVSHVSGCEARLKPCPTLFMANKVAEGLIVSKMLLNTGIILIEILSIYTKVRLN